MNLRRVFEKHRDLILGKVLPGAVCLCLALVIWYVVLGGSKDGNQEMVPLEASEASQEPSVDASNDADSGSLDTNLISIYVAGAVKNSGVYQLEAKAVVADAIEAAGGISGECDTEMLEKHLNLAEKLLDGDKVYIPRVGDSVDLLAGNAGSVVSSDNGSSSSDSSSGSSSSSEVGETGKTSINNASKSELIDLYGIGEVYSQKIIDGRPYSSVSELMSRKIIPSSTYEKIKDDISL